MSTNGIGVPSISAGTLFKVLQRLVNDDDDVFVATAFTPNGDGNNDVLNVRGTDISTMDFRIVNQWGELIFESRSQNFGWDGTHNGKPAPPGTYHFLLNYTNRLGSEKQLKGLITLLK